MTSHVSLAVLLLVACSSTPHRDEIDPRPPPATIPPERLSRCDVQAGVDAAICRVAARVAFARERRDTVLGACLNAPYQRLVGVRDSSPDGGTSLGDVMMEREVMRLEREAEDCPGD
jgi:hypothetical protein